ncbi:MAG: hypothetical protein E6936_15940 [Clostridium perfringens]|uniref:hypothetical protein n=1 Tax=Clostridium perfringens TaxID=1502 RepID=UPI000D7102AF|nr:hypothetical protein [Clostridium perfringens]MCX0408345.1 hypothetical protein [Clostridium perfringens]MDU1308926.1 hypothetical protein [Clostridium perfringens]PWX16716.1 hypothetical protein CYK65_15665 [Clostridium perfringens]
MDLKDIKTLREVALENNVALTTLISRIESRKLIDGVDYRKLGKGQSIILSPSGVKKILLKSSKE